MSGSRLHHAIIESVLETGAAPSAEELATAFGVSTPHIERGLRALQDDHGVVLHPGTTRVWVIHPFSLAPTGFLVRGDSREWWAPCAWCALGVAALVGPDVDIVTTLGGDSGQATVRIRAGKLLDTGYCVHFPVPMRQAWENVIYTCSVMLLFAGEPEVDRWCDRHRMAKGDVQPLPVVWDLARTWYGRHRDADWRKWSTEEAGEIFARLGLAGETWRLPGSDERF